MNTHTMEERKRVSVGRLDLLKFGRNELAFFGLDLDRLSTLFLAQMFQMRNSRAIDIFNVTNEIKALEGIAPKTRTKKECPFKQGSSLEGLHYTHFNDPRFILENLASEFGYKKDGNKNLDKLIGRLFHEHKGEYVDENFARIFSHEVTIGAYKRRTKRGDLTGEWIVFKKYKGKRYYLCLAAHTEANEDILSRAEAAMAMDFEFL